MNYWIITAIGFLAQGFFSARILVQWIMSERAQKVLSPSLFWIFSICGSYLLTIYGWLRDDFSIILGQCISYYIYLYNLYLKGSWGKIPKIGQALLIATPIAAGILAINSVSDVFGKFFENADVPIWLLIYGSTGQVIFTLRFIYQWLYSRKKQSSQLPATFWIISLVGSLTIVSYGIIRHDIVLILGQSFGLVAYIRNLMIGYKQKHEPKQENSQIK